MNWFRHKKLVINLENVCSISFVTDKKCPNIVNITFRYPGRLSSILYLNLEDNYERESYEYLLELTRGDGR